jgi:[ribosomal protein S5]-alanine N-acetyltransferase
MEEDVRVKLPLHTARLELRPFTDADLPAAHRIYSDPEVMRYVGHGPVRGQNETRGMLAAYAAHQAAHGYSFWAVVERESGALIGDAGLFLSQSIGPEVEVGYTLARSAWGRGYATEAAHACLDAAFGPLGLDEVIALVVPENARSLRVVARLGMAPDGRRHAYGREHLVFRRGRMAEHEQLLRSLYGAFNARDVDAVIAAMHPDVDWPNAWEGGRVRGHAAVRDYWARQFAAIDPHVEPRSFTRTEDGRVAIEVHQVVRSPQSGEVLSDLTVTHVYALRDGLVERMDVVE